ncbi:MAG: carbohydrate kinase family protein [Ignisphaera sp.]
MIPVLMFVGVAVCDIILVVPQLSRPGDIVYLDRGITISLGGHPCNISIDLVKLGYSPSAIHVVSAVGEDFCGKFIEDTLASYSIQLKLFRFPNVGSNKNVIIVVNGEDRRFHVEVGASTHMSSDEVLKYVEEVKPSLLHVAPGLLGDVDDNLENILRFSSKMGILNFVDVGAAKPYGKKDWSFLVKALEYADIFHCNRYELRNVLGVEDVIEGIKKILGRGVKIAVITDGEKGAYIAKDNYIIYQKPFKVDVVDPTGAGDAFQAGFIYKLVDIAGNRLGRRFIDEIGYEKLIEILTYAQAVGAVCVTAPGTTTAVKKENVENLLKNQSKEVIESASRIHL